MQHLGGGNGIAGAAGAHAVAEPFIGGVEEELVPPVDEMGNQYRAAGVDAEVVLLIDGTRDVILIAEEIVGVHVLVAQKLKRRTVQAVGAGFGGKRHVAALGMAEFRLVTVGFHREFGDGIQGRSVVGKP